MAKEEEEELIRTTMSFPPDLMEKIDDLLYEGKKNGTIARGLKRNPYIIHLLEERVGQLMKAQAKKRSTD